MIKLLFVLVALAATCAGIVVYFPQLQGITHQIPSHSSWWGVLALAVIFQIIGHIFRAQRTKLITDQASASSLRFQFGALSAGYLFNALLPFRLGELVRAWLVARRLRISFLYTLSSIAIERAVDVILLGGLIIMGAAFVGVDIGSRLIALAAGSLLVAGLLLTGFLLLLRQNPTVLNFIWKISSWFNVSINNSFRFKVWSLIFGLQQFFSNRRLVRNYFILASLSWLSYFLSTYLLATLVFSNLNVVHGLIASVAPYVATAPSGSIPRSVTHTLAALISLRTPSVLATYTLLLWTVLILPMSALGVVALMLYRTARAVRRHSTPSSFANKLQRFEDISQAFPAFLDSYFSGNQLAQVLHKLETAGTLRLVKFFKGGSDAITVLVMQNDELFVKKVIPLEYEDRLKAQYLWLENHHDLKYLVGVKGEQKTDEYYAIDLDYDPENIPLFEYIHHSSLIESKRVVEETWRSLHSHLYKAASKPRRDAKARDAFIAKHIIGCVEKASSVNGDLMRATVPETITINGRTYDNLHQILAKIKEHPEAWRDIATFAHAPEVHGDMAIDNILVSPKSGLPVIIDPAPDGNTINGPVFDMGKLSQSFYCGYEFLFRDNEPVDFSSDGAINYRESISHRYGELWRFLHDELAPKYLNEGERRSMLFHAATLHIRVLKHRVYINPDNVLKFYAVGVKTLNEFLAQYENEEQVR